jgi:hypothetical protein
MDGRQVVVSRQCKIYINQRRASLRREPTNVMPPAIFRNFRCELGIRDPIMQISKSARDFGSPAPVGAAS